MSQLETRTIKGEPFLWVAKPVMRKIREAFDASHEVPSAIVVYVALAEIASDGQSETFTTTQGHIAQKCGLSVRTVAARLKELVAAGLIEVITPDLRAPSAYRLLAFGNGCVTISNGCRAFCNDRNQATLPTLEESKKNVLEESLNKTVEDVYSLYPKKVSKPDALRAIRKALKTVSPEFLKERTVAYAKARNGNLEFVPNPATWFNGARYNDDPKTWAPKARGTSQQPDHSKGF